MLILVTYDINTETSEGQKRLRDVAKHCVSHGQRVQNSVFECVLDHAQYHLFRHELEQIIDPQKDSLRFYELGEHYARRTVHIGAKPSYEVEGNLIL